MRENYVRSKMKRGEASVGTWLSLPDPFAARLMARAGFDWLTVDLEHSPTNLETAALSFAGIAGEGVVPLVRAPSSHPDVIKRVLDMGAFGIVVPMVNSRAEAEAVVRSARYAPAGQRSVGGQYHALNFDTDSDNYYARANDQILVVIMAEHVEAIAKADEILSVPGVDAVFIGPNDLHQSLGKKPAFDSDDPDFRSAVSHVLSAARKNGISAGIHVFDAEAAKRRIAEGFQFIAVSSEAGLMLSKASETCRALGLNKRPAGPRY